MKNGPVCIHEGKNICGEGPVWDGKEQALYWVDIPQGLILRRSEADGAVTQWSVGTDIGAMALRADGGIVAGLRSGFAFFDPGSATVKLIGDPEADRSDTRFNDGKCDPQGRFWCGTFHDLPDPKKRQPVAALYRLDADLTWHKMLDGVRGSNGIGWSPDGRTMYYTDTPTYRIDAFDFDPASGALGNRRVFAALPAGVGRPDGLTVDAEGFVWSAHFDGWRVTRYRPDGAIDRTIMLPVRHVTSCAFGGADLRTLYITSATEDLTDEELADQPLAGGLFAYHPGVGGLPMARFAG
ncbi:MAG: SMP-30/gluconolactonase/LRE family protein [Parvibaculaceae bacterium]